MHQGHVLGGLGPWGGRKCTVIMRTRCCLVPFGWCRPGASIGSPKVPRVLHALFRSPVPLLWFIVNRTKRHNPINYSKDRPTKRVSGCVLARFPGSPVRRSKRFYCAVIPLQTRHSSQMDHINTRICPTPVQAFFFFHVTSS
jgi:hypothetical protein